MCNCLEEVRKSLMEETGSPWIRFENTCHPVIDGKIGKLEIVSLRFAYESTTKTGKKKVEKSFTAGSFCTFCGKPYLEQPSKEQE